MIYLLKTTIQWLKNHLGLFKTIFLISVIVIIVGELMSIGKTIDPAIRRNVCHYTYLEKRTYAVDWSYLCVTYDWL